MRHADRLQTETRSNRCTLHASSHISRNDPWRHTCTKTSLLHSVSCDSLVEPTRTGIDSCERRSAKGNGLEDNIDGVASELLESCLGLLANVVSAISQLAVVIQILRGREGAATLFLLPLLQLVIKSRISNSLWDFGKEVGLIKLCHAS